MIKRFVCLANSRKLAGRCVAGRELVAGHPGKWIRPVSDRPQEEVSEYERQYVDGSDPQVLDIIDVMLIEARPKSFQPENWLIDPTEYWVKIGQFPSEDLDRLADTPGPIWINGHHTYNGQNDYVTVEEAEDTDSSLKLIAVDAGLQLEVNKQTEAFGNRSLPC